MYPNVVTEHFLGKCVAVAVALLYVGISAFGSGFASAIMILILAVLPLLLIWFPGEMSSHLKPFIKFQVYQKIPAIITRGFGWVFLVLVLGMTVAAI